MLERLTCCKALFLYEDNKDKESFSLAGFMDGQVGPLAVILDGKTVIAMMASYLQWEVGDRRCYVPVWAVERGYMKEVLPMARDFILSHPLGSKLISHVMVRHPYYSGNYQACKMMMVKLGFKTTGRNEYCDIVQLERG